MTVLRTHVKNLNAFTILQKVYKIWKKINTKVGVCRVCISIVYT